jgi:hypothetical protein
MEPNDAARTSVCAYELRESLGERGEAEVTASLDDTVDDAPPRTAMEAFLRSAHLDHGDPQLPAADDTEVATRYARDASEARARREDQRDEETLGIPPAVR